MKAIDIILKETGFKSIADLKKHLKTTAVNQYGCNFSEIKKPSFRVYYTSNPNHFCSFGVSMSFTGMTKTKALDYDSITMEGKKRGCETMHL